MISRLPFNHSLPRTKHSTFPTKSCEQLPHSLRLLKKWCGTEQKQTQMCLFQFDLNEVRLWLWLSATWWNKDHTLSLHRGD